MWKRLDLRDKNLPLEKLIALRLAPKNGKSFLYSSERYDIGKFGLHDGKKWWRGSRGTEGPAKLKQHYDIWWCAVAEFDGI